MHLPFKTQITQNKNVLLKNGQIDSTQKKKHPTRCENYIYIMNCQGDVSQNYGEVTSYPNDSDYYQKGKKSKKEGRKGKKERGGMRKGKRKEGMEGRMEKRLVRM